MVLLKQSHDKYWEDNSNVFSYLATETSTESTF
jgi:hypothetical protein